jgi:hypothetical protein
VGVRLGHLEPSVAVPLVTSIVGHLTDGRLWYL